jgi:DNA phosphorothioation-dependent restriction protein DptG
LGIKTYSDFEKLADERSLRKFIELTLKLDSRGRVLETDHYLRMLTNVTNLEGKRIVVQQLLELMKQGASFTKKERNLIMTEAGKLGLK